MVGRKKATIHRVAKSWRRLSMYACAHIHRSEEKGRVSGLEFTGERIVHGGGKCFDKDRRLSLERGCLNL